MITNRVQLNGNLGANPEIKTFESGDKVAKLSLATNEQYTNRQGETITDTQWHTVVVKSKRILEKVENLEKGRHLMVEGRLSTRYYEKEGEKRYVTEIVAYDVYVYPPKSN